MPTFDCKSCLRECYFGRVWHRNLCEPCRLKIHRTEIQARPAAERRECKHCFERQHYMEFPLDDCPDYCIACRLKRRQPGEVLQLARTCMICNMKSLPMVVNYPGGHICGACRALPAEELCWRREMRDLEVRLAADFRLCEDCMAQGRILCRRHYTEFDDEDSTEYCKACQRREAESQNADRDVAGSASENPSKACADSESESSDRECALIMFCDGCQSMRPTSAFSSDVAGLQPKSACTTDGSNRFCKRCVSGESQVGRTPGTSATYRCATDGCSSDKEEHFLETEIVDAAGQSLFRKCEDAASKKGAPKCAQCMVREDPVAAKLQFRCEHCKESKALTDFSAVICKQHLRGERRPHKRCHECQYPQCCVPGCSTRPAMAILSNHVDEQGQWICLSHRYPPCCICRSTPRPLSAMRTRWQFRDWTCEGCQASSKRPGADMRTCATTRKRRGCGQQKPLADFRVDDHGHHSKTCSHCEFPACVRCRRRRQLDEGPVPRSAITDTGEWICGQTKCNKKPRRCEGACGKVKEAAAFGRRDEATCLACQRPQCETCRYQHSGRAVYKNATGWIHGTWYCKKCEAPARKQRRLAASSTTTLSRG